MWLGIRSFLSKRAIRKTNCKSVQPEELLTLGESWAPLSDSGGGPAVEFIPCAAKRPLGADPAPGYVVRTKGRIGYVMLDIADLLPAQFEQGRIAGREEERNRIVKAYHEEVSSSMIAALFLMETAKSELEEAGLPQAEVVSKASEMLTETTGKIAEVLSNSGGSVPQSNRGS